VSTMVRNEPRIRAVEALHSDCSYLDRYIRAIEPWKEL